MLLNKAKKYQFKYLQEKLNHWNTLHLTEDEPFRIHEDERICFLQSWLNKINKKYNYV